MPITVGPGGSARGPVTGAGAVNWGRSSPIPPMIRRQTPNLQNLEARSSPADEATGRKACPTCKAGARTTGTVQYIHHPSLTDPRPLARQILVRRGPLLRRHPAPVPTTSPPPPSAAKHYVPVRNFVTVPLVVVDSPSAMAIHATTRSSPSSAPPHPSSRPALFLRTLILFGATSLTLACHLLPSSLQLVTATPTTTLRPHHRRRNSISAAALHRPALLPTTRPCRAVQPLRL